MYLFTSGFVLNTEQQKCEKDIEQDIISNKMLLMCVCHNIKTGHGIVVEVWDLI